MSNEAQQFFTFPKQFSLVICALFALTAIVKTTDAATYKTANFIVNAKSAEFAKRVGTAAEQYRKELAVMWIGKELPNWSAPCPIHVKVGQIGAGGATTFSFHNGEVFGWKMNIQGSQERILDSVLPHEITHTILACRFRQPLPRWADEGICTLVEHESERRRQTLMLGDVMRSGKRIPLRSLFSMTEYPSEMRDVLKLYAQGYSLVDYLVQQGGRETFLQFLHDALRHGGWDQALSAHYGVNSIDALEKKWGKWVFAGSPSLSLPKGDILALNNKRQQTGDDSTTEEMVVRGQSPEATSAPHPLKNSQPQNKPQYAASSATSFNSSAIPTATKAVHHESARSRGNLTQPILSRPVNNKQSRIPEKKQRSPLQLTREEFRSPQTPLSKKDRVHPFAGKTNSDPFAP